jgi:hypothetical protein
MSTVDELRSALIRNFTTPDETWQTIDRAPRYDGVQSKRLARCTAALQMCLLADILRPGSARVRITFNI